MEKLTKHNTALDLSRLTEVELREISKLTQLIILDCSCKLSKHSLGFYHTHRYAIDDMTLVSLDQFRSIHFPESVLPPQKDLDPAIAKVVDDNFFDLIGDNSDKPTYEELVEALKVAVQVVDRPDIYNEIKQLIERIKS